MPDRRMTTGNRQGSGPSQLLWDRPATTTLKLPEHLKNRKSSSADARAAEREVERTGLVYRGVDVHRFIRARRRK